MSTAFESLCSVVSYRTDQWARQCSPRPVGGLRRHNEYSHWVNSGETQKLPHFSCSIMHSSSQICPSACKSLIQIPVRRQSQRGCQVSAGFTNYLNTSQVAESTFSFSKRKAVNKGGGENYIILPCGLPSITLPQVACDLEHQGISKMHV